jgi:CBS domain-containing protein
MPSSEFDELAIQAANVRAGRVIEDSFSATCDAIDSLPRALEAIRSNECHAAAVLSQKGKIQGVLTLRKIIKNLVALYGNPKAKVEFRTSLVSQIPFAVQHGAAKYEACVHRSVSLFYAFETLAKTGLHAIALVDERDQVYGILSQRDVLAYFFQHKMISREVLNKSISHFRGHHTLALIDETTKAINAFRLMARRSLSHVAVVDNNGRLIDQICESDIRAIGTTGVNMERLELSAATFKMHCKIGGNKTPLVVCTGQEKLELVLGKMLQSGCSCCFVVDSYTSRKPIDVITFTDILMHWATALSPLNV